MSDQVRDQTIRDFGRQWTKYTENEGFYGSLDLLKDFFGPLLPVENLQGKAVADIGSGTGRIVLMLLAAGAAKIYAIEPSDAVEPLARNVVPFADRVEILHIRGDQMPPLGVDMVVSIGVIHHIPDPDPVMRAAYAALKPGGQMLIWLYGREGNELYLSIFGPVRAVTKRLPHFALVPIAHALNAAVGVYVALARRVRVPMRDYVLNVLGKLDRKSRYQAVVYDQLNPAYAKYYRRDEALDLMRRAGFADVQIFHRHGYSWTVRGTRG